MLEATDILKLWGSCICSSNIYLLFEIYKTEDMLLALKKFKFDMCNLSVVGQRRVRRQLLYSVTNTVIQTSFEINRKDT